MLVSVYDARLERLVAHRELLGAVATPALTIAGDSACGGHGRWLHAD